MSPGPSSAKAERELRLQPQELAAALRTSIESDLQPMALRSEVRQDQVTLAFWGKAYGLDHELGVPAGKVLTWEARADLIAQRISPHPGRFAEVADQLKAFEARLLKNEAKRLEACGTPWGRIVRLFWRDRSGRVIVRERGLHACKHRWCPRCGRSRQVRLVDQMEQILVLIEEWGLSEANLRFLTLTIPNGPDIPTLRKRAHEAWARLQRTRTWPREVFGWFRGTEIVTGQDGNWNLHLHVVVAYWTTQISYEAVWKRWEAAVGQRCQVDIQSLVQLRRTARVRGTARAARYIVKYLTKREGLASLAKGPGGLAHLFGATRHFRTFAMGGGCSLLRRVLPILMPRWALRAERILAGSELRDGQPPIRAEEVDPESGETFEIPPPDPCFDSDERKAWTTLAARLADDEGIIGVRCGPLGRFRRLGALPLPSRGIRLKDWERAERTIGESSGTLPLSGQGLLTGIRRVIGDLADWAVFTCDNTSKVHKKDANGVQQLPEETKPRTFRMLLPRRRFGWKQVAAAVWAALLKDSSPWSQLRRAAIMAWAEARITPLTREDHLLVLRAALDDRVTQRDGVTVRHTTRRAIQAADLLSAFAQAVLQDPKAVWDEAVQRLYRHAEQLTKVGLLDLIPVDPESAGLRGDP